RLPALRGLVIRRPRLDPARALRRLLLLPERRAGLEVVHDELARGKGLAAVRAGDDDQHDLVGRLELADAVDDEHVHHLPALLRLVDDFRDRLLGHARVVLEGHRAHGRAVVRVAAYADEARDRADLGVAPPQRGDLGAGI